MVARKILNSYILPTARFILSSTELILVLFFTVVGQLNSQPFISALPTLLFLFQLSAFHRPSQQKAFSTAEKNRSSLQTDSTQPSVTPLPTELSSTHTEAPVLRPQTSLHTLTKARHLPFSSRYMSLCS